VEEFAMALVDYYLKIDGIEGESQDQKHKGEIEIDSFSWGQAQSGTAATNGGIGAGVVAMHDVNFVMKVNKASPRIALACANGDHIKNAVLVCRKAGKQQQEFLKYTFSDVLVSSYHTGGSQQNDVVPIDQFSLNFGKIECEYKEQKSDGTLGGTVKMGWDVKKRAAV
jgi:type VI secretion system secreted protein Hcp